MSFHSYLIITGKRQGLISAGCSSEASIGNRCQIAHFDKIMVLSFKHLLRNPDNTQGISHQPVFITKFIDKATPLLAQALNDREIIDCVFEFHRINTSGHQEKYFSIKLSGGLIVQHEIDMPHSVVLAEQDPQEYVSIRYRDISWLHHGAGTGGGASWGEI